MIQRIYEKDNNLYLKNQAQPNINNIKLKKFYSIETNTNNNEIK